MISINNLTVAYGGFTLLDDINFHISGQDRIGLVGKNGAGKSTMLKLIYGLQSPTSGKISIPSGCKVGYLPQIMEHHRGRTVLQEAMTAFDSMHQNEKELERVSAELSQRSDYESAEYMALMLKMNELTDSIAMARGEMPEVQARKTLKGLGFKDEELGRPTETFSQGWNMRIELAKILLQRPDVLLLDEPTNHLDIESIEWLEEYLKLNKSALVVISHDRKFLDTVTNRTVEIMLGHIHDYKVPYSRYLELRAERMEQQRAAFENQQRMIEKTEDFIERFRYKPTKSNQVQSRVKALEKLDRIEIDLEDRSKLCVKFPPAPRSGDVAFKAIDLTVGYPDSRNQASAAGASDLRTSGPQPLPSKLGPLPLHLSGGGQSPQRPQLDAGYKIVFSGANIEIKRGEKVAFVGRNGEGKTTLMRVIMNELEPISGEARTGHNVCIGYYQQNQEDVLDKNNTVFGTLDDIAVGDIRTKLRDILGAFLFKGEDIDKKVSVLSGGERARLAMAKLMLKPYNLLALDEPTNHMDIRSKDVLKQALASYDGTLVVVSHDRDFLDGLVDKIYEFRDGKVSEHLGGLQDYLHKRRLESLRELERGASAVDAKAAQSKDSKAPAQVRENKTAEEVAVKQTVAAPASPEKKFISKEERKIRQQIARLEETIGELEAKVKEIESKLMEPKEGDNVMELTDRYLDVKSLLDARTDEWAQLIEQIED
ncbi:MAG: ABC-F family ATP-binding cassette domain-containing protein [Bacteroidales bacterium]|nr:ABC-F family ATP-binding cassette domain-containing protein [Bacteroidales bacterium]